MRNHHCRTIGRAARRTTLALAVLGFGTAVAADVEEYRVSQLEWTNHGVYNAVVSVRWKDRETGEQHSSVYGCRKKGNSFPAGSQEFATGQRAQCMLQRIADNGTTLTPGDEVWLHINILSGDNKSCRKDEKRIYFDPESTQRASYSSGGTTLNNNRCKWRGIEEI